MRLRMLAAICVVLTAIAAHPAAADARDSAAQGAPFRPVAQPLREQPRACAGYQLYTPDPTANANYTRRFNTVTHRMLDAQRDELGTITPEMYALLDHVIADAVTKLRELETGLSPADLNSPDFGERAMAVIDCVLLSHGFVYPPRGLVETLGEALSLTTYGSNRELDALVAAPHNRNRAKFIRARALYNRTFHVADCDTASFIYLAVSEVMKYPVYLVDISYHDFVRWVADDGRYLNFETMDGVAAPDSNYRVPKDLVPNGGLFKSLNATEAMAYFYTTIGVAWNRRLRESGPTLDDPVAMKHIVDIHLKAIALDPVRASAANNLAWYYAASPNPASWNGPEAVKYAELAVARSPDANLLDTLACAYARNGQFDKAHSAAERVRTAPLVPSATVTGRPKDRTADFQGPHPVACIDDTYGVDLKPFRNGTRGLVHGPSALVPVPAL